MSPDPSWQFLEHFRWVPPAPPTQGWSAATSLVRAARSEFGRNLGALTPALARSDRVLARLGGDPARRDWRTFRPLALRREEDWSDWLAYLLEGSRTGVLGATAFGGDPGRWARPARVLREWTLGGCRADLAVELTGEEWVHVEVKVGDEAFRKTYDTGAALRVELGPGARVSDVILLLAPALDAWDDDTRAHRRSFAFEVTPVTWRGVALGLRRSLARGGEEPWWEAWAFGFLGCVEQVLLGHPTARGPLDGSQAPLPALAALASMAELLESQHGGAHA